MRQLEVTRVMAIPSRTVVPARRSGHVTMRAPAESRSKRSTAEGKGLRRASESSTTRAARVLSHALSRVAARSAFGAALSHAETASVRESARVQRLVEILLPPR